MRPISLLILAPGLFCLGIAGADAQAKDPILERVAEKVVQKYQSSSCQQLATERGEKKPEQKEEMEERLVNLLRNDAQMRQAFLDRVAAPIANKLFECGLIP